MFILVTLAQACALDTSIDNVTFPMANNFRLFDLRSTGDVLDCVTSKPAVLANTCALITAQMCFDLPSAYSQVAPGTLSVGCQGYNTIGGRKLLTQLNTDAKKPQNKTLHVSLLFVGPNKIDLTCNMLLLLSALIF